MHPRRTSRRAAVVAAPWTLMAALRVTGTERGFPLVPALSFTPHAAVSAVLPLSLAIRARSVPGALLSAAACAGLAPAVLARRGHRRDAPPPRGRPPGAPGSPRRGGGAAGPRPA